MSVSNSKSQRTIELIRAYRVFDQHKPQPAQADDITWRKEVRQIASLIDRLDVGNIERFCEQRSELSFQLRRLAARREAQA